MSRRAFIAVLLAMAACTEEKPAPEVTPPESDIETLREQVAKNPADGEAWYQLSDLYGRGGLYALQVQALQKVIAVKPEMGYAYFKLGTTYNRLGRHADAVEQFKLAEKHLVEANQPVLQNNLAVAYGKLGKVNEEIESLKKAIALRPDYAIAHYNLGMAQLRRGQVELALAELRTLQEFDEGAAAALKKEIDARRSAR